MLSTQFFFGSMPCKVCPLRSAPLNLYPRASIDNLAGRFVDDNVSLIGAARQRRTGDDSHAIHLGRPFRKLIRPTTDKPPDH